MTIAALDRFSAQIGELAQHQLSNDPNVQKTSEWYYEFVTALLNRQPAVGKRKAPRYLELACYRHILGYKLAKDRGFDSTHFDICDRDLELGREIALSLDLPDSVDRVAGDFHNLPFADAYFDFVMISAAIHHTRSPHVIIEESMRVLSHGGIFYCQREPCERLFCFFQFNANRPNQHTAFEAHLHERDIMRLISSPYPGARNAEMFGRVENDRIPLEMYYDVFNRYGRVVEEVLYCDGLLTGMDKRILANDHLPETELAQFIQTQIADEMEAATLKFSKQDELLGYSLPTDAEIRTKAEEVAAALKARPTDAKSVEWRRSMVKIFGGSLRFAVERQRPDGLRADSKFKRECKHFGNVKLDHAVYEDSGLHFWDKILPDIQTASIEELHASSFPEDHWTASETTGALRMMMSRCDKPKVSVAVDRPAVAAMRYRVVVDERLPAARVRITLGDDLIADELVAQNEDRMARFFAGAGRHEICFSLTDLEGRDVGMSTRLRISILQCIPISEKAMADAAS